jgi:hypothetical protein
MYGISIFLIVVTEQNKEMHKKILVGKPEGKRPLEISKRGLEVVGNIWEILSGFSWFRIRTSGRLLWNR